MLRIVAQLRTSFCAAGLILGGAWLVEALAREASPPEPVRFNRDIRPILADQCFNCHGPDQAKRKAKLRLDERSGLFGLPDRKPPVVPGQPDQSELFRRITTTDADDLMPPRATGKTLTPSQIALLKRWIAEGASWQGHWAYEPVRRPPVPRSDRAGAGGNPIDDFIVARLKAEGLRPAPEADRRTLWRRSSLDLTGLPPRPEDIEMLSRDAAPGAYETWVERLLASPHFGERMAVFWLDLVRYSDTDGFHADNYRSVWPYRDYVIRSFNEGLPFDQFTIEQLAGDLLPDATLEQRVASTFNRLNRTTEEGGSQPKEYLAKYAADRVRATAGAWLGSTFGCAECHDHKYDPLTLRDFYSFEAFFADIQEVGVGVPQGTPLPNGEQAARLRLLDAQIAGLQSQLDTPTPVLAAAQARWEEALRVQPLPRMSPWHALGPFAADQFGAAFKTAFPPEKGVDLAQTELDGKLKWTPRPDWEDGKVHNDLVGENSATYLFRTLTVDAAQSLGLSLGSDDGLKVWVNGKEVLAREVNRGAAADQDKLTVELQAGENRLLLKIVNAGGTSGFYFKAGPGVPDPIQAILAVPAAQRSEAQQKDLAKYHRSIAPELAAARTELESTRKRREELVRSVPTTLATVAVAPRPIRVLPRGNWMDDSGEIVSPAVPAAFGTVKPAGERATRLELARWLVARENPLTARVLVNRLWKLFFGTGLSKNLDDLGLRGEWPSHPELLDWLAAEFMDSGWDVKHMVRLMVTSRTYRQSSVASRQARERDPENRLLARQSSFRLEAEWVRDHALAAAGLLNDRIGGPSVKPYQPAGYWDFLNFPKRTWEADRGEALYRRGLYTFWCRTFLHPSLVAFDAPSREECTASRLTSNTPLQALTLLNDPTYFEAARALAERAMRHGGAAPRDRIRWAFDRTLQRAPDQAETALLEDLYRQQASRYAGDPEAAAKVGRVGEWPVAADLPPTELAAWTAVTRTILNLHETITRY